MAKHNKYYDVSELLSHNGYISFVMSGRGMGKSFSAKKKAINNFLKRGKMTAYVRRTQTELSKVKNTFFNDVQGIFKEHEFKVDGDVGYINNEPAIIFIPLSTSSTFKSASYPLCDFIIFDEYIITQTTHKRYLKNEMTLLLDLIETLFRDRKNVKTLFMSNAVSFVNPLFSFFNIEPSPYKRFQKFKDGLIVLEQFSSDIFTDEKEQTPFAKLIKGTYYHSYAIGNEVLEDSSDFVTPKPPGRYDFLCSFIVEGKEYGIWLDIRSNKLFMDEKLDKQSRFRYALTIEDVTSEHRLVKHHRRDYRLEMLREGFNDCRLYFTTQEAKKMYQLYISKNI